MAEDTTLPIVDFHKATPVAQKIAIDLGVDLNEITGSGNRGKITKADVLNATSANGDHPPETRKAAPASKPPEPSQPAAPPPPTSEPDEPSSAPTGPSQPALDVSESIKLKGVKKVIARRMGESVHTTARVTLVTEVDATEFVALREQLKAQYAESWDFAPGYNDLLIIIVSNALRQFPYMNARLSEDGEAIEHLKPVNMGMAVDTDRGLLVPVIKDTDTKGLQQIGAEFRELAGKARSGKAAPEELSGSTFTITSLGIYRVDAFTPVINLPEIAILGVGRIKEKPVVKDGEITARKMMTLSLVFDHRLTDGAPAARFLDYICDLIEDPAMLFIARR